MNITATIITHNEERNIERCLSSLIGVADEIVVVDSFSTDATADICRRYGCRVVERTFTGYGSQRQYAAGLATGPYVLSIDADEFLSEELRENIIALKTAGFGHRMYAFRVVNYICGHPLKGSGLAPNMQTRLFDKRYATWDLLDVGERLSYPGSVLPRPVHGELCHYRCGSYEELELKEMRNAQMRGRMLAAAGIRPGALMCVYRGVMAMLKCHFRQGAMLDGEAGRRIALLKYYSTSHAYRTARSIVQKGK